MFYKGRSTFIYSRRTFFNIFKPKTKKGHQRNLKIARKYLKKSGFKWDKNGRLLDKWNNRVEFTLLTNAGIQKEKQQV